MELFVDYTALLRPFCINDVLCVASTRFSCFPLTTRSILFYDMVLGRKCCIVNVIAKETNNVYDRLFLSILLSCVVSEFDVFSDLFNLYFSSKVIFIFHEDNSYLTEAMVLKLVTEQHR